MDEKGRNEHSLKLCSAKNDQIITLGQIDLSVRLRCPRCKTIYNVVEASLVKILIGIDFMDHFVTNMYRTERHLKPLHSRRIAIFSTRPLDKFAISYVSAQQEEERHEGNYTQERETKNIVMLRVVKQTSIEPNSTQRC